MWTVSGIRCPVIRYGCVYYLLHYELHIVYCAAPYLSLILAVMFVHVQETALRV